MFDRDGSASEIVARGLEAALEDGDPSVIAMALGNIAKARGASEFARETGLSRETIYKAFRAGGNPTLDTVAKAAKALHMRLTLVPANEDKPRKTRRRIA